MPLFRHGNYSFTLVNGKYVTEEKRNNSGIYSWQGEATFYHTFKDDSELDVKGYYFYSRRGLPGAVTLYNPLSDETLWDENTFVQARYRKHFSPRWSLQAQAKYNHGWNKYKDEGKEYTATVCRNVLSLQDILPSVPSMHATGKDGSRPRLRWCILPLRSMPRKVRSPMTSIALPPLYQSVCSLGRTSRCISG